VVGQHTCEYETVRGDDRVAEWPRVEARKLLENCLFHKFHHSSIEFDCSLQKTATGNGNLQPEIEINEYSSTRVVLEYSSTRGSPTRHRRCLQLSIRLNTNARMLFRLFYPAVLHFSCVVSVE